MSEVSKFRLLVTAGPSYDTSQHQLVPVNLGKPIHVKSDYIDAKVNVRVQNYRGLPTHSPTTSSYFANPPHEHDLYSIGFDFKLLKPLPGSSSQPENSTSSEEENKDKSQPQEGINGLDLLFGNDFDHPIRDRLPPGFSTALRIVRWAIDPGLNGDVYVDEPYLYGPLLSSINTFHIGDGPSDISPPNTTSTHDEPSTALTEGASPSAASLRTTLNIPSDGPKRMKHFLDEHARRDFTFECGREYSCDFFNPYLDFNEFSLKLPGFTLPIIKYWDGQPLRYVLKHKQFGSAHEHDKGQELLVVLFTLVPVEKADEEEKKWLDSGRAEVAKSANAGEGSDEKGQEEEDAVVENPPQTQDDDDVD